MEELVKIALQRLDNLELEKDFLNSRRATRLLLANTFANNLEIVKTHGDETTNKLMDNYLEGMNETFKAYLFENFPGLELNGNKYLHNIKTTGLIKIIFSNGFNQIDIASRLEVTKPMITYFINGKRKLKIKHLFGLLSLANKKLYIE